MRNGVYIDFEMNKFRDGPCEIIAIGAIKVRDNWIVDRFYSLVALERSDEISVHITLLTGITNFDIQKARKFSDVWGEFLEWAGNECLYCWGRYDKSCLVYTWRIHAQRMNNHNQTNIYKFTKKMIDLEAEYGYDGVYHKQSLKDILISINKDVVIDPKRLHNPVYDAELLFEFHKAIQLKS